MAVRAALVAYTGAPGVLCVWSLPSKRSRSFDTDAASIASAVDYVRDLDVQGATSIYHQGTTMRAPVDPAGRGTADGARAWLRVQLDADFGKPGYAPDAETVRALIERAQVPPPSAYVHSGHGLYPQWEITPTAPDSPDVRALALDVDAAVRTTFAAAGYKLDQCSDAARVWRLPGTVNRKDPAAPVPCRLIERSGEVYTLAELRAAVPVRAVQTPAQSERGGAGDARHAFADEFRTTYREHLAAVRSRGGDFRHELFTAARDGWRLVALDLLDERAMRADLTERVRQVWGAEPDDRDRKIVEHEARDDAARDPWVLRTLRKIGPSAATTAGAETAADAPPVAPRRLRMVRASAVTPKAARWLWQTGEFGRIPLGEVSVLAGRGNVGKSPFALWLAAKLTRGELAGELFGSPVDVVVYASEDSHEHTTVPRLTAAGADLDRVHLLNGTETDEDPEMPLVWARDVDLIREAIEQTGAGLLIIDPLIDVHRGGANTDRTDDVRAGLRPLVALAHRTGVAVAGVAHFNKQKTGDVASLLSGSHGLRDTVRAVLAFVERPNGERVLGQDKNNLGRAGDDVPRLTYDMESIDVPIDGMPVSQPVFTITGTTDATLSEVLLGGDERDELSDDVAWLFERVAAGHPRPLHARTAAEEAETRGLRWDTVRKKASRTGLLRSWQERGAIATWVWGLTEQGVRRAGKAPAPPA